MESASVEHQISQFCHLLPHPLSKDVYEFVGFGLGRTLGHFKIVGDALLQDGVHELIIVVNLPLPPSHFY